MEEKSGLNTLVKNLAKLGLLPDVSVENKGALFPPQNTFAHSYTVTASLSDTIYFVARSNISSTFTGIFSTIELPEEAEYKIYKRNWFDFILQPKRKKIKVKFIDENITIISSKWIPSKELNMENAKLFLDINKRGQPYHLILANNYLLSIYEPLANRKIIGIETNDWIDEVEELEFILKKGEELIRKIKNTYK